MMFHNSMGLFPCDLITQVFCISIAYLLSNMLLRIEGRTWSVTLGRTECWFIYSIFCRISNEW